MNTRASQLGPSWRDRRAAAAVMEDAPDVAGVRTAADRDEAARAGAIELGAEETNVERAPKRARLEAAAAAAGGMDAVALGEEGAAAPSRPLRARRPDGRAIVARTRRRAPFRPLPPRSAAAAPQRPRRRGAVVPIKREDVAGGLVRCPGCGTVRPHAPP